MTPEVIKTLIEIANEQQRVMAAQAAITRCPRKAILHTNPDLTPSAASVRRHSGTKKEESLLFQDKIIPQLTQADKPASVGFGYLKYTALNGYTIPRLFQWRLLRQCRTS